MWEALFGNAPAASQGAIAALELSKERDVEYGAALALALSADSSRSQTLANDLETRFPQDTAVRSSYLPTIRAVLALNRGEPSKALELLKTAAPFELGVPLCSVPPAFFGALYPAYFRGAAYLALHQGIEAAVEFQKILDHRGIVISDPIGALAHLQLGQSARPDGQFGQGEACLSGFPEPLERRRPRHPDLQAGSSGIREAAVSPGLDFRLS